MIETVNGPRVDPIAATMNTRSCAGRFCHSSCFRLAAIWLVALACSIPAFCGEIHDAAAKDNLAKVQALLTANPDLISSKDNSGYTPLHMAAFTGHKDVAELLLGARADVDARNNFGETPLHLAAFAGHKDVAELLLAHGADVSAVSNNGSTALQLATSKRYKDVAQLLRQHIGPEVMALLVLGGFLRNTYCLPDDARPDQVVAGILRCTRAFVAVDKTGYTFACTARN